ncbi:hypothetical protein J6P04_04270 [bacterium]|nr:hypothetical protein [bacterium]
MLRNKWGQNINQTNFYNYLAKNNIKPVDLKDKNITDNNWYQLSVKNAIELLNNIKITPGVFALNLFDKKIELRPEQQEAIELTSYSYINGGKQYL